MIHAFPHSALLAVSTVATAACLVGCNSSDQNYYEASDFLLAEEPNIVRTVYDVRATLLERGMHDHEHDHAEHSENAEEHGHDASATAGPAGPISVSMVGVVGGLTNPWQKTEPDFPFVEGRAKFFLADPGGVAAHQAEGHSHAPGEDCAFCAAHASDDTELLAVVQFEDKDGQVIRRDARQLFDLKGSETVVVLGTARIVEGGLLVVEADALYVRR